MEKDLLGLIGRINERIVSTRSQNPISETVDDDEQMGDVQVADGPLDGPALQTGNLKRVRRPGCRRQKRLEAARNSLSNWRQTVWKVEYSNCIWGPEVLLPDAVLKKLASRARIKTVLDIKDEVPEWLWVDEYGDLVLKLLEPIDSEWYEENEKKKEDKKAKKAKTTADKKVKREGNRLEKSRQATVERTQRRASLTTQTTQAYSGPSTQAYAAYHPSTHAYAAYHPSTHAYAAYHPNTHAYAAYHPNTQTYDPSTQTYAAYSPSTHAYAAYHPPSTGTQAYAAYHPPSTHAYAAYHLPSTQAYAVYHPSAYAHAAYRPSTQAYDPSIQQQKSVFTCPLIAHSDSDMHSV